MLARSPAGVWVKTLTPTVVSMPSSRKCRPSAMESLTEPPLESSTTVAPASSRPRAKSSNSVGVSVVTMPTALTQPRQLGWQATQPNFIGILRSSRVASACAAQRNGATSETRQSTAVQSSAKQQKSGDLKSLKLVPSPSLSPANTTLIDSIYHTGFTKWYPGDYLSSIATCRTATR